jgi:hypothetical protein
VSNQKDVFLLKDQIQEWQLQEGKKEMEHQIKQVRVHNGALVAKMMVSSKCYFKGSKAKEPLRQY